MRSEQKIVFYPTNDALARFPGDVRPHRQEAGELTSILHTIRLFGTV